MKKNKGFTLVELVIVIAVIAILASVLLPTFAGIIERAKENARIQQATSARNEFLSGNAENILPADMVGYVIKIDNHYYKIINANGEIEEITDSINEEEFTNVSSVISNSSVTIFQPNIEVQSNGYGIISNDIGIVTLTWYELKTLKIIEVYDGILRMGSNIDFVETLYIDTEVTKIDDYAFCQYRMWSMEGCENLKEVYIPETVTRIGNYAFNGCTNLETINIPNTVTDIGCDIFGNCSSLATLKTENGLTYIGNGIDNEYFMVTACDESVTVANINENTKIIDSYAFSYLNSLTTINIPEGIKIIANNSISSCNNLTTVNIPNSIEFIGNENFRWCDNLNYYTQSSTGYSYLGNESNNYLYLAKINNDSLTSVTTNSNTKFIGTECFYDNDTISSITLNEGLIGILSFAFTNCDSLTQISLPTTLKFIGYNAFGSCSFTSIVIPEGVEKIGAYAFAESTGLTQIILPSTLKYIEENAFFNTGITSITIPENVEIIGYHAFAFCENLVSISLNCSKFLLHNTIDEGEPFTLDLSTNSPEEITDFITNTHSRCTWKKIG